MIISPDNYLIQDDGTYHWTFERSRRAWQLASQELYRATWSGQYRKVVLLCGIPGSGKSTWLKKYHEDDVIYFDATFVRPKARNPILRVVRQSLPTEIIVMDTPFHVCMNRNAQRPNDRRVPDDTMHSMYKSFYSPTGWPTVEEGFSMVVPVRYKGRKLPSWSWKHQHDMSIQTYHALSDHNGVRRKDLPGGISSFNFTRDVFFSGAWSSITTKARGLFVDFDGRHIIARSYDKFFNVDERPNTSFKDLKSKFEYPVSAYVKENGYLGLVGYTGGDELFFASKSTSESDFAGWLKDIFYDTVSEDKVSQFKDFIKRTYSTFIFEVNDPVNDPHMIAYEKPHLVLLDIVHRSEDFEKVSYEDLVDVANYFGFLVKKRAAVINNAEEFSDFTRTAGKEDYKFSGAPIEGFVFEDASNFQIKIKLPFYAHWKRCRTIKEKIWRAREKGTTPKSLKIEGSDEQAFFEWCNEQDSSVLERDIIKVRALYLAGTNTPKKNTRKQYVALKLDKYSKSKLLSQVNPRHPKVYGDHVTLFYDPTPEQIQMYSRFMGEEYKIQVQFEIYDSSGQTVKIKIPDSLVDLNSNQDHHITISCAPGIPPQYSNELLRGHSGERKAFYDINIFLKGELVLL